MIIIVILALATGLVVGWMWHSYYIDVQRRAKR